MKNLFVLHTQYNIILGASIIYDHFKDCQNDLVVYAEFAISGEMEKKLRSYFNNVLFVRKVFSRHSGGRISIERQFYKEASCFKNSVLFLEKYDNVFLSQERPFDSLIVGYCKRKNSSLRCWDIEEDCYYSLTTEKNNPLYKEEFHNRLSHYFRKLLYGCRNYNSEENRGLKFYGQASFYDGIYALYPNLLRPELKSQKSIGLSSSSIVEAINFLYGSDKQSYSEDIHYTVFFFDLIERYKHPNVIKSIVNHLANSLGNEKSVLLLKYHPRETNKYSFDLLSDKVREIASIIPAEKLLCDLSGKNVTVYGNATTSVIVAQKLGFKTVSIVEIEGSNNRYMIEKFKEMGIIIPKTEKELIESI